MTAPGQFPIVPPVGPLETGSLLVAMPSLQDPNFRQTVVFLCDVSDEGAMGLVVNRPSELLLSDALPDEDLLTGSGISVFDGGPVQTERILLLRRGGPDSHDFTQIHDDLSLGGTMDALKEAATESGILGFFRPYRGYAGWGAGQLQGEIEESAWAVLPFDAELVFAPSPHTAWQAAMAKLGGPLTIYATMPADIHSN
ncbi:MAG: YqgE/AlgH family protein [Nitrospirota bacterium]|nr:YqgE/AlgH family protein [Nitrospirota bacterium]